MKKFLVILAVISVIVSFQTAYAVDVFNDDIQLPDGKSVNFVNNVVSIARTNLAGDGPGSYLTERGFSAVIFKTGGDANFGTGGEIARFDNSGLKMADGKSFSWGDLAMSISRTDTTGTTTGSYLTERGFSGIVFRTGGDANFGTGVEVGRIDNSGLRMISGKSFSWGSLGVSIASTDTTGTTSGSFLNERGFSGIVFRTGGDANFGTGDEQVRITAVGLGIGTAPTQKLDVDGNIRLTGNILSPNDICIGTC